MFHVVTVHWNSDAWIDPQRYHLGKHLPEETSVYAALHGVPDRRFSEFYYAADLEGSHPDKLDALARVVLDGARDDDFIVFLDGDAFPIRPIPSDLLGPAPLAAVRRAENLGEQYPHPCFCVTTVGFWRRVEGSWQPGPIVPNALGQPITDVGCTLFRTLEDRAEEWTPLLRSNTTNLHPLWFGVYANLAYHHGAGFRDRLEHVDARGAKTINPRVAARATRSPTWLPLIHRAERSFRYRSAARRSRQFHRTEGLAADRLADEVFQEITNDPDTFYRRFVSVPLQPSES
jgi:hypothetical protein